jgi:hypothetical protein
MASVRFGSIADILPNLATVELECPQWVESGLSETPFCLTPNERRRPPEADAPGREPSMRANLRGSCQQLAWGGRIGARSLLLLIRLILLSGLRLMGIVLLLSALRVLSSTLRLRVSGRIVWIVVLTHELSPVVRSKKERIRSKIRSTVCLRDFAPPKRNHSDRRTDLHRLVNRQYLRLAGTADSRSSFFKVDGSFNIEIKNNLQPTQFKPEYNGSDLQPLVSDSFQIRALSRWRGNQHAARTFFSPSTNRGKRK